METGAEPVLQLVEQQAARRSEIIDCQDPCHPYSLSVPKSQTCPSSSDAVD
jgi:hypothetical protein